MTAKTDQKRGEVYLRPDGFLGGDGARQAIDDGKAGQLAGGWAAFSLVEIISRKGQGGERCWASYEALSRSDDATIKAHLKVLQRPAADFAGLPEINKRPQVMGIVNVTPDSFSDGGQFCGADQAIAHAKALVGQGADMLDIGGESTRPGAAPVTLEEETSRVVPVISGVTGLAVPVSIDSRNAPVMEKAIAAGADFINDVTALSYCPDSLKLAARSGLPVCLMHSQGTPQTMQDNPDYDNVVLDVYDYLAERIAVCKNAGIDVGRLMVDPGIGFGKTLAHNLALLDQIGLFHGLGVPILLGASRKSFIGTMTGQQQADARMPGSIAVAIKAGLAGVQVLRVHDVAETSQSLKMAVVSGKQ
jgi:dihydropteroate synthase